MAARGLRSMIENALAPPVDRVDGDLAPQTPLPTNASMTNMSSRDLANMSMARAPPPPFVQEPIFVPVEYVSVN